MCSSLACVGCLCWASGFLPLPLAHSFFYAMLKLIPFKETQVITAATLGLNDITPVVKTFTWACCSPPE